MSPRRDYSAPLLEARTEMQIAEDAGRHGQWLSMALHARKAEIAMQEVREWGNSENAAVCIVQVKVGADAAPFTEQVYRARAMAAEAGRERVPTPAPKLGYFLLALAVAIVAIAWWLVLRAP